MLSKASRVVMGVAALCMVVLYLVPLWRISLFAPQYPEGLGFLIRLHTISGIKPNDLNSINGLNHYIGMKTIDPTAIAELRYLPWIVGLLIVGALAVSLSGKQRALWVWLGGMTVLLVRGMIDFWRWEYDYGHNLDMSQAIIVVPGMSYQPPLIGTKQLLNFSASSWPDIGAWILGLAFAAGVAILAIERRRAAHRSLAASATIALRGLAAAATRG